MTKRMSIGFACLALAGCRMDMQDQPRYKPLQPSRLFADGRSARPLPEGTIARGHLQADRLFYTGRTAPPAQPAQPVPAVVRQNTSGPAFSYDPGLATEFPMKITAEVLISGRRQFERFCIPCHGYLGNGRGMIVQRGFSPPPSFHIERLRAAPPGHFFDVITNGYGAMFSYASRVKPDQRWAIIAYIRALQLSQGAEAADVPPERLAELQKLPPPEPPPTGAGEIRMGGPR